jgi:hypothetical protein
VNHVTRFFSILVVLLTGVSLFLPATTEAQLAVSLRVAEAAICKDVVDRAPVGAGTTFDPSVGQLYCFTKIGGAHEPTAVTHAWYFGDTECSRVTLPVDSEGWRTKSSKKIQPHETGRWHVDILGPQGELLQTVWFDIASQQGETLKD